MKYKTEYKGGWWIVFHGDSPDVNVVAKCPSLYWAERLVELLNADVIFE